MSVLDLPADVQHTWDMLHKDSGAPGMAAAGRLLVNLFLPDQSVATSDVVRIMNMSFSELYTINPHVPGPLPDTIIEAVTKSLLGVYGLAHRRGVGHTLYHVGSTCIREAILANDRQRFRSMIAHAKTIIDPITDEVIPAYSRMRDLRSAVNNGTFYRKGKVPRLH